MKVIDEDTGEEIEIEDGSEDLREVEVVVAVCSKCGGAFHTTVKNSMTRTISREYAKHLEKGASVYTTNVIVARSLRWCEAPCEGMYPKKTKKK